jgi:peptidoglycan/LPS O-acetylase OafA/YrhL
VLNEPKQYFHLLSALRGIAAVLVVVRHTGLIFSPIQFQMSFMSVDIFFLLSGVVIEANYQRPLKFGLNPFHFASLRIIRIYPLYFFASSITIFATILAPKHVLLNGATPYASIISHKILTALFAATLLPNLFTWAPAEFPLDHPAWSLFFELYINFIYGFIATKLTLQRIIQIVVFCWIGSKPVCFIFVKAISLKWDLRQEPCNPYLVISWRYILR